MLESLGVNLDPSPQAIAGMRMILLFHSPILSRKVYKVYKVCKIEGDCAVFGGDASFGQEIYA